MSSRAASSVDPSASSSRDRAPIRMTKDPVVRATSGQFQWTIASLLFLVSLLSFAAIAWLPLSGEDPSWVHASTQQVGSATCMGEAREAAVKEGKKEVLDLHAKAEEKEKTRVALEQHWSWVFTSTAGWGINALLLLDICRAFPADKKTVTIISPSLMLFLISNFMPDMSHDHALVANVWLAINTGFAIKRILDPDFAMKRGTMPAVEQVDSAIKLTLLAGVGVLPALWVWMLLSASKDGAEGSGRWEAHVITLIVTLVVWTSALLFCWKRILMDSSRDVTASVGPSWRDAERSALKEEIFEKQAEQQKAHEEALHAEKRITRTQAEEIELLKKVARKRKSSIVAETERAEKAEEALKAAQDKLNEITEKYDVGEEAQRKLADLEDSFAEVRQRFQEDLEKLKQAVVAAEERYHQQKVDHGVEVMTIRKATEEDMQKKQEEWEAAKEALTAENDKLKDELAAAEGLEGFQKMLNTDKEKHKQEVAALKKRHEELEKETAALKKRNEELEKEVAALKTGGGKSED